MSGRESQIGGLRRRKFDVSRSVSPEPRKSEVRDCAYLESELLSASARS
jgi:hypothetical protein